MSPCHNCHAGCCRAFAITVTGADILRIEAKLSLDFWDFVCRWEDREGQITSGVMPQFFFDDEPETPFAICLQHTSSEYLKGTTKCGFLKEEAPSREFPLGRAHCGAYADRPLACRIFPTKLDHQSQLAVVYNVPENGRGTGEAAYSLCPRPFTPDDFDAVEAVQNLVLANYEIGFFQQVAAVWNRKPDSWRIFPEFLRLVYAERLQPIDAPAVVEQLPVIFPISGFASRNAA